MASSQGRFELNVFAPILAESFIESTRLLGDAIHSFDIHCAQGIKVNEERMAELVEKSLMLVTAPVSPYRL
jgi:fumarate hydratase class II